MTDYGHDLMFGTFITPRAAGAQHALQLAAMADTEGLDLVTFQDHPYQPAFLDTWTLMTYVAARTTRVRIAPNVTNLPLRPPAVLARAAASLDILSGGRFELGIGAGGFWDAIVGMGGRRLTPGQAVGALAEGIDIIRLLWDTEAPGGARRHGEHYELNGAKRGPAPAHPIGIWVGAYKPKMLALTGERGDGWLPSLGNLPDGPASLRDMNSRIDEGAATADRSPTAIRRLLNVGPASGPARQWAEQLADIALQYGISGFILATDDAATTQRYAAEIAPAVREIVQAERA